MGERSGLRPGRRNKFPGRGNKGPEPGRNLAHSRKAREVARQETRGRVASVRLEKWGKVQTMQPSLVTLRIWVFLLRAKGRLRRA